MTGVYEHALGAEADELHQKVRERYSTDPDDDAICVGRGKMDISRGTHVLPALYAMAGQNLLFPEAGHDVPFSVRTAGFRDETGREVLATIREFRFGRKRRRFDSLTVWDAANERLLDFLGTDGLLVSELHPHVEAGALVVKAGKQWLRLGDRYVPMSGPLAVDVGVRDRYDDADEQYHVTATIENTLAGHVLSYRGAFTQEMERDETVPDNMRPTRGVETLPPG
ncbi:DUF4166 domain-containing protein [Halococcus salifodinae]|uniref:DUF4166 domain-containing protein n=1 Tax=Halococcus salifodinae DSM 8989 TaxID=1227456 RepID=M0NAG9_9EURY|nr:DUF4166 domain-containing protein [Halococcus salifodinae]EMA54548.1 hypothetical protein C450_05815 [Halococcus salifodinae DSM 8989]